MVCLLKVTNKRMRIMINYLNKNQLAKPVIIVIPFIILFILQILHLDSDPSPIIRWGTMSDEGFWQYNARMKIMFGNFSTDEFRMAYLGAPIFNQFLYISYKLLGISLGSSPISPLL